jgi:hypothetical protein
MWNQVQQSLYDSIARVMTKVAVLLPGMLAFALAVLLFALIGAGLAWITARILIAARLDERLNRGRAALAEWSPRQTPSKIASRIVFWAFVVAGVLVGLSAFEAAASETGFARYAFAYVPHIVSAAVLLLLGNIVARFLSRSVLISAVNMNLQYARLLAAGVKWLVLVLTAAMVLDHLAIGGEIVDLGFGILFGGIVLALALAVGLGSRDLVSRSLEQREQVRPETQAEENLRHF